jgi:hypothetical protein
VLAVGGLVGYFTGALDHLGFRAIGLILTVLAIDVVGKSASRG